ncbi:MAG: hypothetical protein EOP56_19410 [Sphingobacteriales bacterium]|nr:MAG: hypothetical protein EOP56_19410 [Sphingobacteriales bacterium]
MKQFLFLILVSLLACKPESPKLANRYAGWWAETFWEFRFNKDGKYTRRSTGHYGSTNVRGRYLIKDSVIHLLSGYQNTNGTVNEYYVLSSDGHIVDTKLLFDYAPVTGEQMNYNSKERAEFRSWTPAR